MLVKQRFAAVGVLIMLVALLALVACGDAAAPEPQVVEVEVTKVVTETVVETRDVPVEVTKIVTETVTETVVETRDVPVEVTKIVTETIMETEEVEVTKIVPVTQIVERTVVVEATPAPPAAKDTIVFSDLNWNSALIQNRIAQYIVEHGYGYPTETVLGFTLGNFQGLRAGDIDVTLEIWLPNQDEAWLEALGAKEVVSVGASLGRDWQSTFVIPAYVQEQYPELDHVDDLKDPKYQELFQTNESRGKARLVACPPGWACEAVNLAQIAGHGLEEYLHVIHPGSQDAMFAEVYGAYERQEPWLGYMWGTADPGILLDLVQLEQPEYTDLCWLTDKACRFEDATILIAVHPTLPPRAPEIVEFLHNWDYNIEMYTANLNWVLDNEASHAEGAIYWLENNEDVWTQWITADATSNVQAALAAGEEAEGWPDE